LADVISSTENELHYISSALGARANELLESDADASAALRLLSQVASMYVRADDWGDPYGPMISMQGQRTMITDDLTSEQLEFLVAASEDVDDPLLGSHIADTLFVRAKGKDRIPLAKRALDLWLRHSHSEDDWFKFRDEWERFTVLATRLGKSTRSERDDIRSALLSLLP
jgi:hypothetical protein